MIKENIDKINNLIDEKQHNDALKFALELLNENDQDEEVIIILVIYIQV